MGNPLTAIGKMMITLRDAVFPLYDNWRVNKKLREKLKNEEGILPYIENADRVTTEQLKEEYDNAIWTKDKLEDKDKTIVALRQQPRKVLQENSAQKQEIALLNYELERAKIRPSK